MDSILPSSEGDVARIYNSTKMLQLSEQANGVLVSFIINVKPGSTAPRNVEERIKEIIVDGFQDSLFVINGSSVFLKAREADLVTRTPKQEQCLPASLMECQIESFNFTGYGYTSFPNILGHRSTAEAQRAISKNYRHLFETSCYALSRDFYCSVFEPQCGDDGKAIPPCRQFCIDIRRKCLPKYERNQKFPISCESLPDSDDPTVCRQNPYQPGVCVPINSDCAKLGFNNTAFPNVLGEVAYDREGYSDFHAVSSIYTATRCFKHAMMFACSMHFPPCSGKPMPNHYIPPCRIMCEVFLARCEIFFDILRFKWHMKLNCSTLPNSPNPEVCVGYKETLEAESLQTDCPENHVKCENHKNCIHSSWICDGYQDCEDNSDEQSCESCSDEQMSCSPPTKLCIAKSQGCDGKDHCYAGADEILCVQMDTSSENDVLMVHNTVTSAWEEVCKDGWTREYSDITCQQLGYQKALTEAYLVANASVGDKSMIGGLRTGSDPRRIQSYLTKGHSSCPSGYVVQVVCFKAVCGFRPAYFRSAARIVGGTDVKPGAWPWMASLNGGSGQSFFCGGTIIGPRWILTAGHCVGAAKKEDAHHWFIKTGTTRRLAYSETIQVRHPANFFVHPQFNVSLINYDIALIQLEKPLALNEFVRPVCLPKVLPARGVRCMVTGWGKIFDEALRYQPVLKEVGVDVVSTEYCRRAISKAHLTVDLKVTETMFCAGGSSGHDSCQGDSGGPILCRMDAEEDGPTTLPSNSTTIVNNPLEDLHQQSQGHGEADHNAYKNPIGDFSDRWYQGGIVSWGVACAFPNTPAVYTNLPLFLDWIAEVVYNATGGSVLD